jgi:hypothetical protein
MLIYILKIFNLLKPSGCAVPLASLKVQKFYILLTDYLYVVCVYQKKNINVLPV